MKANKNFRTLTLVLSMAALAIACASAGQGGSEDGQGTNGSTTSGVGSSGADTDKASGASPSLVDGSSGANSSTTASSAGSTSDSTGAGGSTGLNGSVSSAGSTGDETPGAAGDSSSTVASGGGGADDPPATGGAGTTEDPPDATGGMGTTEDPPTGGTGQTQDPGSGGTADPGSGGTGDPGSGGTGDPGTGGTIDPPDECVPEEMLNINVIVFGDASPSGADVEGRMFVGGDATFDGSGYSIGTTEVLDCSRYDLVVGGTLAGDGGAVVNNGSVYVGDFNYTGSATSPSCGVDTPPTPEPVDFVALKEELVGISLALAQYPVNGSTVAAGTLRFTGDDPVLNVFSVTTAQLEAAAEIALEVPETSTVIVNVTGTSLTWQGKGFVLPDGGKSCRGGSSVSCSQIVWNMPEVTELTLGGIGVQGSIFAPFATFTGDGGNVDGQVIVENLIGGIEFHPYFFTGCLELPI